MWAGSHKFDVKYQFDSHERKRIKWKKSEIKKILIQKYFCKLKAHIFIRQDIRI